MLRADLDVCLAAVEQDGALLRHTPLDRACIDHPHVDPRFEASPDVRAAVSSSSSPPPPPPPLLLSLVVVGI